MKLIHLVFLISFIKSYNYKIIDLEPHRYRYYVNDMSDIEDNIVIYRFQPKSDEKNIFISFLGHSNPGSFEFFLYSNISDIYHDNNGTFSNYSEKFINYGEIHIDNILNLYYILVKMNSYEDIYKYLSFMMYNLKDFLDLGKYNEYILALEGNKNIILNYPAKNITQYLYIETKSRCENITYFIYKNNIEPELVENITNKCYWFSDNIKISFIKNNNYYVNISINSKSMNRMELYILDNDKGIRPIKDHLTDIKYADLSFKGEGISGPNYQYFFINIENLPDNGLMAYQIFDPFNSQKYIYKLKYYNNYNISELPRGSDIKDFDYAPIWEQNINDAPMILIRKSEGTKGLLLHIESCLTKETNETMYNEMIT